MSRFKPYPEYKNSGVEWLGEVPEHWDVVELKRQLTKNDGGVWGNDPTGNADVIVLRSTEQTAYGHWKIVEPALRSLSVKEMAESLLREGDLVVTKSSGSSLHIGKTSLVTKEEALLEACFGNFMQRLRTQPTLSPKIAWYYLNASLARAQLDYLSSTTTGLANLKGEILGQLLLPLAPRKEQDQICRFLGHETARIDALIAEQEHLIDLLKEKRQAVISHAATKGLNSDVPMKDSGVEWLGKMPAHWILCQSKYLTEFVTSGSRGWSEHYSEEGPIFFRITNLLRDSIEPRLDAASIQRVAAPSGAEGQRSKIRKGDLLISITADLGSVCVANDALQDAYVSQHVALVRPLAHIDSRWFAYFVASDAGKEQLLGSGYGGTKIQLSLEDVKSFTVPVPPIQEQVELVATLDQNVKQIDKLIAEQDTLRTLLQERRAALISAAVTGKIDVRHWQPPAGVDTHRTSDTLTTTEPA